LQNGLRGFNETRGGIMELYKELLQLITPIIGGIALFIFQKMSESVSELNKNVAVVIEKIEKHEKEIAENKENTAKHSDDLAELKIALAKKGIL
jgi:uncharacterized membrane protein